MFLFLLGPQHRVKHRFLCFCSLFCCNCLLSPASIICGPVFLSNPVVYVPADGRTSSVCQLFVAIPGGAGGMAVSVDFLCPFLVQPRCCLFPLGPTSRLASIPVVFRLFVAACGGTQNRSFRRIFRPFSSQKTPLVSKFLLGPTSWSQRRLFRYVGSSFPQMARPSVSVSVEGIGPFFQ